MKTQFKRRAAVLATLVVALGIAVYLNYYFADSGKNLMPNPPSDDKTLGDALNVNGTVTEPTTDYFAEARKNRETAREEALEIAKDLLNDVKATEEQKKTVTAEIIAITKAVEQESDIESLLKAKGYTDCVVYLAQDTCNVVVKSEGLTVQDTAKISQVVTSQANISAQKINIVPVKS